jgi:hypothetical protein
MNFTPKTSKTGKNGRRGGGEEKCKSGEEKVGDCALFLALYHRKDDTPITLMRNLDSPPKKKTLTQLK